MHALTLHQRADERPIRTANGHTLMLGTSAGIRNVHDARTLPFDTITFLLRAESARKRMGNATGRFFAFDKRLNGDVHDNAIIQNRTERLRQILASLLPHFSVTTHSELIERGLSSTIERVEPCAAIEDPELRQYTRIQTAQVLHMHAEARNGENPRFAKFGWILSRRGGGVPVGGEVNFDQMLPNDVAIERIYTAPAFPLNSNNGKAPYLLNESDRAVRICLPDHKADIGKEVQKIQCGISHVMLETIRATAETVLHFRSEVHAQDDELVTLPLTKAMKLRITDESELSDVRELLSASLRTLLP